MSPRKFFQHVTFLGIVFFFLLAVFTGLPTQGDDLLKANLDLPF